MKSESLKMRILISAIENLQRDLIEDNLPIPVDEMDKAMQREAMDDVIALLVSCAEELEREDDDYDDNLERYK